MVMGVVGLVKLFITVALPGAFADPDQAALMQWPALVLFWVMGTVGALLAERTGFPPVWDTGRYRQLPLPFCVGLGFGVAMTLLDRFTGLARLIAANHNVVQQYTGFVPMLLVFGLAAPVIVEVVYRLFAISLLLWFTSNVILRGHGQNWAFWILAVVLSGLEPFTQTPDLRILPTTVMLLDAGLLYALNLTQVVYFRKYGVVASILVRSGFYFVWHVLHVH